MTIRQDRGILFSTGFLRSLATGTLGVMLGIYLSQIGLSPASIGYVVGAGLAGGAVAALLITIFGDRLPRRATLVSIALLSSAGAAAAAASDTAWVLALVSFLGMLNGMGRDRGAALVLEQALLPQTSNDQNRTKTFAWFNVLQDSGHAIGGLIVGFPLLIGIGSDHDPSAQHKALLLFCAILMLVTALLYTRLSLSIVAAPRSKLSPVSPETKKVVGKLSGLFLLDSLGGGFLTTALISFFFFERFGVSVQTVGILFFAARVLNALSHLGAAWLARRIGLVNTMVFTHIPSSIFLASVGFAPNFTVAAILFLLREGLVEMDVPTRQSYVMAVVKPEERTFASGATSLVRLGGWAIAPAFAGLIMQGVSLATPLIAGAGLKILYDVLLFRSFRKLKPPEEV